MLSATVAVLRDAGRPLVVAATLIGLTISSQAGLSGRLRGRPKGAVAATYVVQPGDTLSGLAKQFGVSIKELAGANNIGNIHKVLVGKTLGIPGARAAAAAATATKPAPPPPSPKLPPALLASPDRLTLMPVFEKWAGAYGVAPELVKALAWMESGWQNDVVSPVGARGIGQLTPDTSRFVADRLLRTRLDPAVPEENIRMSARFVAYLLSRTGGDERAALAAYYQGLGSLQKSGVLSVSKLYVDDVMVLRTMFS